MMIRPGDDELEMILSIAVKTAPNYAIRNVFSRRKMDRRIAVETIVQRVFQSLRRYEIQREALEHEKAPEMVPLFLEE